MTYEEIVGIVRDNLENADAREIFEHIHLLEDKAHLIQTKL